ncbi:MAG: M23 family metallopeptidase [Ignavibacteria bacterium]|nr:M23 family metallopeptidase [Ignavibacteria bacterium]
MFKNLKVIFKKRYDLLLIPKDGRSTDKILRTSLTRALLIIFGLMIISNSILLSFLAFTPIMDYLPGFEIISKEEMNQISEIKEKMLTISKEFERVKRNNERLQLILEGKPIPMDERELDSNYVKERMRRDSIRLMSKPLSNNLFIAFKRLLNLFSQVSDSNSIQNQKQFNQYTLSFISPVVGVITQKFYPKNAHYGIDFAVRTGTQVRTAGSGVVIFSDYTINDGYKIIVAHSSGYITIYQHLSVLLKKEREKVFQGDVIALSGNTGKLTTAPHLHFEVWKNNKPIDPKTICVDLYEK